MVISALVLIKKKKDEEYAMLEEGGEAEDKYYKYVDLEVSS
jgi:hypothetical protein